MIPVLCYSCSTHLANTDVARLDWPMTGEMFDVIYPGWFLRPGPLSLEIWCPACGQFPFSHDPYTAGAGAVGKNLNVRGPDGKPVVMTIKQILLGSREPAPLGKGPASPNHHIPVCENGRGAPEKRQQFETVSSRAVHGEKNILDQKPAFPCPSCGAKKRFHKKGCVVKQVDKRFEEAEAKMKETATDAILHGISPGAGIAEERPDPHLKAMESRVSRGPDRSAEPTPEEIATVARERESRRERPEPVLRPGEGFSPKAAE